MTLPIQRAHQLKSRSGQYVVIWYYFAVFTSQNPHRLYLDASLILDAVHMKLMLLLAPPNFQLIQVRQIYHRSLVNRKFQLFYFKAIYPTAQTIATSCGSVWCHIHLSEYFK